MVSFRFEIGSGSFGSGAFWSISRITSSYFVIFDTYDRSLRPANYTETNTNNALTSRKNYRNSFCCRGVRDISSLTHNSIATHAQARAWSWTRLKTFVLDKRCTIQPMTAGDDCLTAVSGESLQGDPYQVIGFLCITCCDLGHETSQTSRYHNDEAIQRGAQLNMMHRNQQESIWYEFQSKSSLDSCNFF